MTATEKTAIITTINWCINRVRSAKDIHDDYEDNYQYADAADDVSNKLLFLLEYLSGIETQ